MEAITICEGTGMPYKVENSVVHPVIMLNNGKLTVHEMIRSPECQIIGNSMLNLNRFVRIS